MITQHSNFDLAQRDMNTVWHPCTQMKDHEAWPPIPIKKGEGVWLEDHDGNRYLDAISSWWVNLFGHANPRINQAISDQLGTLEQVMLSGFTHEPVVRLSERLVSITPEGLDRCFYADNGSCAVEIAMKMSFHYWQNVGKPNKQRFVNLANAYHGETLGALSVCDVPLYKKTYGALLLDVITAPSPDCYHREQGQSWEDYSRQQFVEMEKILSENSDQICAVIVEPLVQGAGFMRMYHPIYLTLLREACDKYEVHLIADEIATGFGRTGTMFACEQANISPDFMCLSKGITGGYLPLSTVLTSEKIYQAFYDDFTNLTGFLHSHSYTGNPLACQAAHATLDIFEQDNVIENNKKLAAIMKENTKDYSEHSHISEVRQTGMMLAIEMIKDKQTKQPFDWQERRGRKAFRYAMEQGVLLRPMGDVIYFMPPYVINEDEIKLMAKVALESIDHAVSNN
ncbi:MAG: adenosylmethionine--8-amino-7-oxononanoate transaminase [Gammaproteobacteria bacterium]